MFWEVIIGTSLIFIILTYNPAIGAPFLGMYLVSLIIRLKYPNKLKTNNILSNTHESLASATIAFVIFIAVTFLVSFLFSSTSFFQGTVDFSITSTQSILRHGFASTGLNPSNPIFVNSKLLTYYTYGFVIPFVETTFIISLLVLLTTLLLISLNKFSFKLLGIYIIIAWLFVLLHANVKGVEDNVALFMTFIFAIITLEIYRRGTELFKKIVKQNREVESAIWLHVLNNIFFIANKIGF